MSFLSLAGDDDDHFLCVFTTKSALDSERAMNELADIGVGREMGTISTTSIAFRNEPAHQNSTLSVTSQKKEKKGPSFSDSVKSRMIVKQVVERIMNSSAFTFDYVCMLVVASLIAAGGLATDNAVIVVASMLVSPLMGPVLAFTFGVTLKEKNMAKLGLFNEVLSLLICVVVGAIVGFVYALLSQNSNNWPTPQMSSRGTVSGLADGAFIAAASGVGVALSVLGDYLSTVVGVAISASLLPPAVNAGMLFAFPICFEIFPEWTEKSHTAFETEHDLFVMGALSLLLTIENIIIIFVMSRFMFWVKDVYIAKDHNDKVWKSVTNFRAMQPTRGNKRQSVIANAHPKTLTGTLSAKARQSFYGHNNMDYDFAANAGTLKGGVLATLNRQRSFMNTPSVAADENREGRQVKEVGLMVPIEEVARKQSGSWGSIDVIDVMDREREANSSDSEQKDSDESEQESMEPKKTLRGQRVGVNDLFTPATVAQITTPIANRTGDVFQERMDSAVGVGVEMIKQNEVSEVSGDAVGSAISGDVTGKDERDDSARPLVQSG